MTDRIQFSSAGALTPQAKRRRDREEVEAKLAQLIQKAETGEDWGEICRIEAEELAPLLVIVR